MLQDRDYVRLDKRRFLPEDRGRLVTAFLTSFFERYVEYNFTADLENQLDEVSGGRIDWKELLRNFWRDFSTAVDGTKDLTITPGACRRSTTISAGISFPNDGAGRDPRLCPVCGAGRLSLKLGKFGAFIGCSNYPNCRYTRPLGVEGEGEDDRRRGTRHRPGERARVTLKKGPFGHYVQLGAGNGEVKPKRVALPRSLKPADVDLDTALRLLALPREIGRHPETGEAIIAGIGRFGPYIKHGTTFKSLAAEDDVLTIGAQPRGRAAGRAGGRAPARGAAAAARAGAASRGRRRWRCSRDATAPMSAMTASSPRCRASADPETFTLEQAIPLLAARREKSPKRPRKAAGPAKAGAAKAKKAPARKAAKPAAAVTSAAGAKRAAAPKRAAAAAKTKKSPTVRAAKKPPRAGAQSG